MSKLNILVYDGPGVTNLQNPLIKTLKALLSNQYDIISADQSTITNSPWEDSTALIVLPGGADLKFLEALGSEGTSKIKSYVEKGGSYLGLCAGAYMACSRVEFEIGRPGYEVIGERPLKFSNAIAEGSVTKNFVYNSELGAESMKIINSDGSYVFGYANGAPCFKFGKKMDEYTKVLYRYEQNNEAAILKVDVDKGKVVLCGPHLEVSSDFVSKTIQELEKDTKRLEEVNKLKLLLKDLISTEEQRIALLVEILTVLGLKVVKNPLFTESCPIWISSIQPNDIIYFDFQLKSIKTYECLEYFAIKDIQDEFIVNLTPNDLSSLVLGSKKLIMFHQEEVFDLFNLSKYKNYRKMAPNPPVFGSILLYTKVIGSTQTTFDKNSALSKIIPNGACFVASHQVQGRGRGNNSWISNSGCLQFSLRLHHVLVNSVIFIQYLVGIAVVQAVKKLPGCKKLPICLKWPNDIYAKTSDGLKKIGGILITSEYLPETSNFALTIGCGINVLNSKPSTCLQDLGEEKIEMELVLALILEEFETLYQELVKANLSFDCFSTFRERYYQHWLHTGQEVTVHGENGVLENMIIQGLDTSGFLKAVSKIDGSVSVLQPDGNSFDMLKNLITVKQ